VALVGEIYVRLDPFANDFLIDKLEERGVGVRFAPFVEWLEYTTYLAERRVLEDRMLPADDAISIGLKGLVQRATLQVLYRICADALGWGRRTRVEDTLAAARPYLHPGLRGEAALTLGGPLHEFREGQIEGVVIAGPHECMPCKVAEAQYGLAAEQLRLPYLSVAVNGDPIDTELLDRFCYDIREQHGRPGQPPSVRRTRLVRSDAAQGRRRRVSLPVLDPALVEAAEAAMRRLRMRSA
jgi:hypothetical protein